MAPKIRRKIEITCQKKNYNLKLKIKIKKGAEAGTTEKQKVEKIHREVEASE